METALKERVQHVCRLNGNRCNCRQLDTNNSVNSDVRDPDNMANTGFKDFCKKLNTGCTVDCPVIVAAARPPPGLANKFVTTSSTSLLAGLGGKAEAEQSMGPATLTSTPV
jgi:hypothetical protein